MIQINDISKLGIGAWGIAGFATYDKDNDDEKQIDALVYTLNKGLNYFEINFWNSEGRSVQLIQEAIKRSNIKRENLFLSLVVYNYKNETLVDVEKEIEKFFNTFHTNYIDTIEFSLTALNTYGFENVVDLVSKYINCGKARFTSLTNSNLEYLEKYHKIFGTKLFSHEVHYSFEVRDNETLGIIPYAEAHNIKNIIYQALRRNRTAERNWALLLELSKKYNVSQNQIILNWMVTKGFLPLIKSDNIIHIDENLDSLNFLIEPEDIEKLNNFKVPNYKNLDIDWFMEGTGATIFSLPNIFDENHPI